MMLKLNGKCITITYGGHQSICILSLSLSLSHTHTHTHTPHTHVSSSPTKAFLGIPGLSSGCVLGEHMNIVFHMTCGGAGVDWLRVCVCDRNTEAVESERKKTRLKTFEYTHTHTHTHTQSCNAASWAAASRGGYVGVWLGSGRLFPPVKKCKSVFVCCQWV